MEKIKDPSLEGVEGLKGLKGINTLQSDMESGAIPYIPMINSGKQYREAMADNLANLDISQDVGFEGLGDSSYDFDITSATQLEDINDTRGRLQPWYDQIANGLAKGAVLAGTTALSGTVGLLYGSASAVKNWEFAKIWDNEFQDGMNAIEEASEDIFKNHYTNEELEGSWTDNIFSANFIGDKFIKNLGFTVGAFYSGNLASMGLKAAKIPQKIGKLLNSSKAPKIVTTGVGASLSAFNEARIEAYHTGKEFDAEYDEVVNGAYEQSLQDIEPYKGTEVYDQLKMSLDETHAQELAELESRKAKAGNLVLGFNMPVLLASNVIQFGRLYANGFKTARKLTNLSRKTTAGNLGRAMAAPLSESFEEGSQELSANVSKSYHGAKMDSFLSAKRDPQAEQQTVDWINTTGQAFNETWNSGETWEAMFLGFLTGALGMPKFRGIKNSDGRFQSPIDLERGIVGNFNEAQKEQKRADKIIDYVNSAINSPDNLNYYQGLIRHNKFQNDMDKAVLRDDELSFRNAAHAQLVSDITMFDNAGKLDDLYQTVENSFAIDDENLESIIDNTTTTETDENGKEVTTGPFIDKDGNRMTRSPEKKQEMIDKLEKNKADVLSTIEAYKKAQEDIDILTGESISDEQLEELTWMNVQSQNWKQRAETLTEEIRPVLSELLGQADNSRRFLEELKTAEGAKNKGISDSYKAISSSLNKTENIYNSLSSLLGMKGLKLAATLTASKELRDGIKQLTELNDGTLNITEIEEALNKLQDIPKLIEAAASYDERLKEYYNNPGKLHEELIKETEEQVKQEEQKATNDFKGSLSEASDIQSFRDILNNSEVAQNIKDEAVTEMEKAGSELAKTYKQLSQFFTSLRDAVNKSDRTEAEKDDIHTLLDNVESNATNLQEASDESSDYLNDQSLLYDTDMSEEDNLDRYTKAQLGAIEALNKAKEGEKFKESIKETITVPEEFANDFTVVDNIDDVDNSNIEKEVSGELTVVDSIDDIEENPSSEDEQQSTVGNNTTSEEMYQENQENNNTDNNSKMPTDEFGTKQYYYPIISELESNATKAGDYRTYAEVKLSTTNLDFSKIYNFLKNSGAFSYINEGKMKPGDKVGFMIDPSFDTETVFLIDPRNNQIIGSLPNSKTQVATMVGLPSLKARIKASYESSKDKTIPFVSTETVTLSKIMLGKIPYIETDRSLKDIYGEERPYFAIVKNGVLSTNDLTINGKTISHSDIVTPKNLKDKEGRLYVLIPNGAGTYTPSNIRVKHFNETEFNPNDISIRETTIFQQIDSAVELMANAVSQDDITEAKRILMRELYLGDIKIFFEESNGEQSISFNKVTLDQNGREVYDEIDGKRVRREKSTLIPLSRKAGAAWATTILNDDGTQTPIVAEQLDINDIKQRIYNTLLSYNLPIQVDANNINDPAYTNKLLNSGVLISDMREPKVLSNWFTTTVLNDDGVEIKAINPERISKPYQATDPSFRTVSVGDANYNVNLKDNVITNENGEEVSLNTTKQELILDLAWADNNFGTTKNSDIMIDNVILTPRGKVLNRVTKKYLAEGAVTKFKKDLAAIKQNKNTSEQVIQAIENNQSKVDKGKTDSESYLIMEEGGIYYRYERVSRVIGNNWKPFISKAQQEFFDSVQSILSKKSSNLGEYNTYLKTLKGLDYKKYLDKSDVKTRQQILEELKNNSNPNANLALNAGTTIDSIIRDFFHLGKANKPSNMEEGAYTSLLASLQEIKSNLEQRGERFLTNNIVLFHKYSDGRRIAGEVDILAVDAQGNFKIYDVKTSKYPMEEFTDSKGRKVNYFVNKSSTQVRSTQEQYTLQLSAYKNLFESQYNTPITTLAIVPFQINYLKNGTITEVNSGKGIPITYNPNVPVGKEGTIVQSVSDVTEVTPPKYTIVTKETKGTNKPLVQVKTTPAKTSAPKVESNNILFNSSLELAQPVDNLSGRNVLTNSKVGYFEIDGVLQKGYLTPLEHNGVTYHIAKTSVMADAFGNNPAFETKRSFHLIYPNGKSSRLTNMSPETYTVIDASRDARVLMDKFPDKVAEYSAEETSLTKFTEPVIEQPVVETIIEAIESKETKTISQIEQSIQNPEGNLFEEFDEPLDFRVVEQGEHKIWNQEKELSWINKVLPQLSLGEQIKITEGLIEAANQGSYAWGAFKKGMIVISDVAAEGTLYHEAFHYVFQTLVPQTEKVKILNEASEIFKINDSGALEEILAERFREYTLTNGAEKQNLGKRILNFFRSLFAKITNWNKVTPHLDYLFQQINDGKYAYTTPSIFEKNSQNLNQKFNENYSVLSSKISDVTSFDNLDIDTLNSLKNKGWTAEKWAEISQQEKEQAIKCS